MQADWLADLVITTHDRLSGPMRERLAVVEAQVKAWQAPDVTGLLTEVVTLREQVKSLTAQLAALPAPVVGPMGPAGPAGEKGLDGVVGQRGPQGERGETGKAGAQGPMGLPGLLGPTGAPGIDGKDGMPGLTGERGERGERGKSVRQDWRALAAKKAWTAFTGGTAAMGRRAPWENRARRAVMESPG